MLSYALAALTWVLPFLFVLTLVVTVHELGHFLVARACGVAIDQFSIGFGRPILKWRDRAGVEWRLGSLPLGGYVRFAGDDNAASVPDANDLAALRREIIAREGPAAVRKYYQFKPVWQRALVAAAGPFANFVLSTVLFAALLITFGDPILPARVAEVMPGSPAQIAGFKTGDLVERAGGQSVDGFLELRQIVTMRPGVPTRFEVLRGTQRLELTATPTPTPVEDEVAGHMMIGQIGMKPPPISELAVRHFNPITAIGAGAVKSWRVLDTNLYVLGRMIRGQIAADQLRGPLGIAQATHNLTQASAKDTQGRGPGEQLLEIFVNLLSLAASMSVMIGFTNLLPIPVLDGGHLVFYAYEAVARRPVGAAVQAFSLRVGLALVLGLLLFTTANDLHRSGLFHFLGGPFS